MSSKAVNFCSSFRLEALGIDLASDASPLLDYSPSIHRRR